MERRVAGIFHSPWGDPSALKGTRSPLRMYRYAVWFKANPRSEAYMRALFAERYPAGEFVDAGRGDGWRAAAARADTLVLLYPDATGLGWSGLERDAQRTAKHGATLRVLNGRRRDFALDPATRSALRLRRALERLMLLELVAIAVFALATPLLLAKDWLSGRR